MYKILKAAMVAALVLSVGTAWAADANVTGTDVLPTDLSTSETINDGNGYFWTNTGTADGYGALDNLSITGYSQLVIGTDNAFVGAAGDIVINLAEGEGKGDITIGNATTGGRLIIGHDTNSTNSIDVFGTNLTVKNGEVILGSSAMGAGKYVSLALDNQFWLDNTSANVDFDMLGDDAELYVGGVAFIGTEYSPSSTGAMPVGAAVMNVAGDNVYFDGGMVIGYNATLANNSGADAFVFVGDEDATGKYTKGDIYMTGRSTITAAGGDTLYLLDYAAAEDGGAALSTFYAEGLFNTINGDVDTGFDNGVPADYVERMDFVNESIMTINGTFRVNDFSQTGGALHSYLPTDGLIVYGDTAKVTGGFINTNVQFENAALKSFDFQGTGFKDWYTTPEDILVHPKAVLNGGNNVFGFVDAGQVVNFGKFAQMDLSDSGAPNDLGFFDIDVDVDREGSVLFNLGNTPFGGNPGPVVFIDGSNTTGGTELFIENTNSIKFNYGYTFRSAVRGDFNLSTAANPYVMFEAIDGILDIEDFGFDGMFGKYDFAMNAANDVYGLVNYDDNGVLFDGDDADADLAYATIYPTYGRTVQLGLSDMAYRAAMTEVHPVAGVAPIGIDMDGLAPINGGYMDEWAPGGTATKDQWDAFNINMLNLLDIAAGRADKSTVGLYNGSAAYGVNQVSASTALTHAQVGLSRSDEIRKINNLVKNSVSGNDAYAASIMNNCFTNRFWAGGFGLWEDADSRKGFDGYKYKSGGLALGYDRMFGPNFIVGASFAATFGDYEDKSALAHNSDIDSYSFNLYATYTHNSGFFGSVFGGYTYSDNDIKELRLHNLTDRLWNTADYHTNTWMLGGKIGYDWKPTERFSVTPSVGLTWINARSSAHDEFLGGTAVMRYNRMKTNQTYLPVELAFGYDAYVCNDRKLNLALNLGYAYNFNNDHIKGSVIEYGFQNPDIAYTAVSREPGHHTFTVGGGLRYTMGRFDIGAKYDYARKAKMDSHRVFGTIGISF